ncbi:carbohydrate ABC transporter permease [Paenibacillaceae bacterium]|nr:carbohydrate ABC transporter permease [Paenibacillaceae bacterium]
MFGTGAKYAIAWVYALLSVYPFLWVLLTSFKNNDELYRSPFSLPKVWRFENYLEAWSGANIGTYFSNSIVVSLGAVIALILICAMASYAVTRVKPSAAMLAYFTVGIMIPIHALIMPTVIMFREVSLVNSLWGLFLVYIAANISISIFILSGFMRGIPKELEEAAMIDGSTRTGAFFKIILPISKPGLATIATLAFLNIWNDYLYGLVLISNPKLKTLTMGISDLKGTYATQYGLLCAGFMLAIIPVMVMYFIFQEQIIKGMTAGAVKG